MKKLIIMLAAAAALFMFPSCEKVRGEGPLQTETRVISNFTGVSAGISGKINYNIDPLFKVEIIAQRNIIDVIETSLVNGHLLVKVKNGYTIKTHEEITVNISAPTADYLRLSGSGDLAVTGNIITNDLDLNVSGSGSLQIASATVANKIDAVVSGSGGITMLGGTAKNEELRVSGSGKFIADAVAAEKAVITLTGSGDAQVKLSQNLDATIRGSGSVRYRGNPIITTHISGSGKVQPM